MSPCAKCITVFRSPCILHFSSLQILSRGNFGLLSSRKASCFKVAQPTFCLISNWSSIVCVCISVQVQIVYLFMHLFCRSFTKLCSDESSFSPLEFLKRYSRVNLLCIMVENIVKIPLLVWPSPYHSLTVLGLVHAIH